MRVPIDEVVTFDVVTHNPFTGDVSDADSAPTFAVYEDTTDTDIGVGGNMTKRTSLTGNYRGSFTASAANGFEAGKWYSVIVSATVVSTSAKAVAMHFMAVPAESSAGVPDVRASSLGTQAKADVNAEVLDVMNVDTFSEPGQGAPAATASIFAKINYLYKSWRNKKTQTETTFSLYNDAESVVDQKSTVSESSGTVTRGEVASGP